MKTTCIVAGESNRAPASLAGRARAAALALAVGLLATSPAPAQVPPPPNDNCLTAEAIPPSGPLPHVTLLLTNVTGATTTNEPPFPSCIASNATTFSNLTFSVWYEFTPAASTTYVFSCSSDTASTLLDTVMAIYDGTDGCPGDLVEVDCNDDAAGRRSALAVELDGGTTYFIVVWAFFFDPLLSGTALQLRVSVPTPPANDSCLTAETIPPAGPFPHLTAVTDILLASSDDDLAAPATCSPDGPPDVSRGVWYKFAPTASGVYIFSLCTNSTATTVFDTVLGIFSSANGSCGGTLTPVTCNDEACGSRSAVAARLNAGTTYFIQAWEFGTDLPIPTETKVQLLVSTDRPNIIFSERLPSGVFRLRFTAVPGLTYSVYGATDPGAAPGAWVRLGTAVPRGGNLYEFAQNPGALPYRFYTVRLGQ